MEILPTNNNIVAIRYKEDEKKETKKMLTIRSVWWCPSPKKMKIVKKKFAQINAQSIKMRAQSHHLI